MKLFQRSTDAKHIGVPSAAICRFDGCDEDASATVGTVALCGLHRSCIEELLDRGTSHPWEHDSRIHLPTD